MDQPISPVRSHIPQRKTRRQTKKDAPTKFFTMGEIKALLNEAALLRKRPELATTLTKSRLIMAYGAVKLLCCNGKILTSMTGLFRSLG